MITLNKSWPLIKGSDTLLLCSSFIRIWTRSSGIWKKNTSVLNEALTCRKNNIGRRWILQHNRLISRCCVMRLHYLSYSLMVYWVTLITWNEVIKNPFSTSTMYNCHLLKIHFPHLRCTTAFMHVLRHHIQVKKSLFWMSNLFFHLHQCMLHSQFHVWEICCN